MTAIPALLEFLRRKKVPDHRHTSWYLFGGLTLFFFGIQVISGILLTLNYQPTPETAHESVSRIVRDARFGWAVRAAHVWSSHLVILCAIVHLASKFYFRTYRGSRRFTWSSGVFLLLILLGFAFTGHLLPWDTTGYFATQIGTEIAVTVPFAGQFIAGILRGGSEFVDGSTLTRMYSLHTVILPFFALFFIGFHVIQNQLTGSASPEGVHVRGEIPFYPDFLYRDALAWLLGTMLLFTLVLYFPPNLGPKADIFASPPPGIRPEWYFLPLFQAIRVLPGTILGIDTELILNSAVGIVVAGMVALPWLDRGNGRIPRFIGVVLLAFGGFAIVHALIVL